jgi:hypothetical protein
MRQQGYEGKMVVHSPYKLKNLLKLTMVKLEKLKEKKFKVCPRKLLKSTQINAQDTLTQQ